jgi:hypothetical protein
MSFDIKITSGARKHGLTRTRIEQALSKQHISDTYEASSTDPKIRFIGVDDRGEEMEIVAVVLPGLLLIIHAMPTRYRRG